MHDLAQGLQQHSKAWKDVNLFTLDGTSFPAVEEQIYADAVLASRRPINPQRGQLEMRSRMDGDTGHRLTEFFGDANAAFAPFQCPTVAVVLNPAMIRQGRAGLKGG